MLIALKLFESCELKSPLPSLWQCLSGPPILGMRSHIFQPRSCAASAFVSCARMEESLQAVCTWSPLNSICRQLSRGNSMCAHCSDNSLVFVSPEPPVLCHLCTLTCPQQYHILGVLAPWSTQWSQGPGNQGSHTPLCYRHVTPVNLQYPQLLVTLWKTTSGKRY